MKLLLTLVAREFQQSRTRLIFYVLCIALGVASVSAVNGFSAQIKAATLAQSRSLMGGDVELSSLQIVPPQTMTSISQVPGVKRLVRVSQMSSMAQGVGADDVKLVEVRALEGPFPLVDSFKTTPANAFSVLSAVAEIPETSGNADVAILDKAIAQAFALSVASAEDLKLSPEELFAQKKALKIASRTFAVAGIIEDDSARDLTQFALGPRVYVTRRSALAAQLVSPTSRFRERLLVETHPAFSAANVKAGIVAATKDLNLKSARVQTHEEGVGRSSRPLTNLNSFLAQIALATLVLSGLGAANGVSEYLRARTVDSALLRSLGASPRLGVFLYGGVTCTVALAGSVLGLVAGEFLRRLVLVPMLKSFVAVPLSETQFFIHSADLVLATLLSLFLLCLPQLFETARRDVWSVLRQGETTQFGFSRITVLATAGVFVLMAAFFAKNAPSVKLGLWSFATVVFLFVLFRAAAALCVYLVVRFEAAWPLSLRLASGELLARRKNQTLTMALAGIAIFMAATVQFLKNDLLGSLEQAGPAGRPNLYFLDVQKKQTDVLQGLIDQPVLMAPVVRARLSTINAVSVETSFAARDEGPSDDSQRFRNREQNLTYRTELAEGEKLEAGEFWANDGLPRAEVSLEKGFATNIGAALGDALVFDIQGVPVAAKVTSLRSVTWQNWRPNFFIVAHPSLLSEAPQSFFVAASVGTSQARLALQKQVADSLPNVSVIDATGVVQRLSALAQNIGEVTTFLAGVLFVSSMLVLAAGLAASRHDRMRHFALLRALGASHRTLLAALAAEFCTVGVVAGTIGIGAAWAAGHLYTQYVLEIPVVTHLTSGIATWIVGVLFTLGVGIATCVDVLWKKPLEVLRAQT